MNTNITIHTNHTYEQDNKETEAIGVCMNGKRSGIIVIVIIGSVIIICSCISITISISIISNSMII